jgi:hypothetical protein
MANDYVSVYGVGLLDDIHNYFPALIYDTGRFQNLANVFSYVRNQLDNRFNLYRHGAMLYNASQRAQPVNAQQTVHATQAIPLTPPSRATRNANDIAAANLLLGFLRMSTEDDLSNYIQLPARTVNQNAWTDPVIVRPTAQAIATGTEPILGSSLAENTPCAICQDTIIPTDPARRLVACQHVYHRGCIDEWFRRSVYCPSCRHDIRLPSATVSAAASVSAASRQQEPVTTPLPILPSEDERGGSYFY